MATHIIRWHVARAGEPPVSGSFTSTLPKSQAVLDATLDQLKQSFPNWAGIEAGYQN